MIIPEKTAIHGVGYGSDHTWRVHGGSKGQTYYVCCRCNSSFVHYYDKIINIFEAMNAAAVLDKCPGKS